MKLQADYNKQNNDDMMYYIKIFLVEMYFTYAIFKYMNINLMENLLEIL